MNSFRYRLIVALMFSLAGWSLASAEVCTVGFAVEVDPQCECTPQPVDQALANAELVFAGTVTSVSDGSVLRTATLRASTIWKGPNQKTFTIQTSLFDACGLGFVQDGQYLVFAVEGLNPGTYTTTTCMRSKSLFSAGEDRNFLGTGTPVPIEDDDVPDQTVTLTAHPNPFVDGTHLRYAPPESGTVTLEIYDALGRLVSTLEHGDKPAGTHQTRFEAGRLPSGLYLGLLRFKSRVV